MMTAEYHCSTCERREVVDDEDRGGPSRTFDDVMKGRGWVRVNLTARWLCDRCADEVYQTKAGRRIDAHDRDNRMRVGKCSVGTECAVRGCVGAPEECRKYAVCLQGKRLEDR
jgi:hypothetical protein